jgi:indolepyruvate ferredoxin oxidoreductase, beta subunit
MIKKILILALGGEGGGTLTEWVVEAGLASGWSIQATSIPGVAQRTGATSYYIECVPQVLPTGTAVPPMCLAPLAGDLDLILSSELLETARAVERGFSDLQRTAIVSSTTRALTVGERTAMGDGRLKSEPLIASLQASGKSLALFDMSELARREGTIVSAVMFGALVASGVLPLSRKICEAVISEGSSSARSLASIRGFNAGFDATLSSATSAADGAQSPPSTKPSSVEQVLALGMKRLTDFQDKAYADKYRTLVEQFIAHDQKPFAASQEAARTLALWMAYEDVIRVADLKSRRSRFEQIRRDYKAKDTEPVIVRDFLKPGVEEIAAILPPALATRLNAWAKKRNLHTFGEGVQMATSSISGLLVMRLLANLKFLRRRSSRFLSEQALIARWVEAMNCALALNSNLALAVAQMPRLIKGYSDTFARGRGNFVRMMDTLVEPGLQNGVPPENLSQSIQGALAAALANPDGTELYRLLGISKAPKEQVIKFARPLPGIASRK